MSILQPNMTHSNHPCCQNRETEVFNLGAKGRRNRMILGVVCLFASFAIGLWMVSTEVHWVLRLALILPMFLGVVTLMQAMTRTCVVLAALGAWDLDCGTQRVPDPDLERRLRHRAYGIVGLAVVTSLTLVGLLAVL